MLSNSAVGTLPYMSPEQLSGQPVDARSDIYSAGAVLYEVSTGHRAFPQTQGPTLMGAILYKEPPPPSTIYSGVPPGVEGVILKALSKDPLERYQTAGELRTALETLTTSFSAARQAAQPSGAERNHSTPAYIAAATIAVLVLILALNAGRVQNLLVGSNESAPSHGVSGVTAELAGRPSVAVLGLVNTSKVPKEDWLATTLPEMLTTELGAGGNLRMVSGEDVSRMKADLALPVSESYSKDTLARIRNYLDADRIVSGSYLAPGNGELRLDLRLQDARTGETEDTVSMSSNGEQVADLVDLVSRAASALREKMGIEGRPPASEDSLKASVPATTGAAELYAEGLDRLRQFDALGAIEPLKKAIAADAKFALAHSALAQAWSTLGYDERARDEQQRAAALAGALSAEERGLIQGRADELESHWDKAATYYLSLKTLYPGEIEYGLLEANALTRGGKPKDAMQALSDLRKTPGPAGQDPRIDLRTAEAAEWLGDSRLQETSAAAAAQKATQIGARWLAASALWHKCTALVNQGDFSAANQACEESRDAATSVQDPLLQARSFTGLGNAYALAGQITDALKCHNQALEITKAIGAQRDMAGAMLNIADLEYSAGDLKSAHEYYQQSLQVSRAINNRQGISDAENGLAADLFASGDYAAALPIYGDILKSSRDSGDQRNAALALNSIGLILFEQGDLKGAREKIEESLDIARKQEFKGDYPTWLISLGDIQSAQDQLAQAEQTYQGALTASNQLGQKLAVGQSSAALAGLLVEKGQAAKAIDLANQAAAEFHTEKNSDLEADALNVVVRALLAQNLVAEARKSFDQAAGLPVADQGIQVSLQTTSARLLAAEGKREEALKSLAGLLTKLEAEGFRRHELEARLAKGEIELSESPSATGRTDMRKLQAAATNSGFLLIARKAGILAK